MQLEPSANSQQTKGLFLGFIGVCIFAMTLPMTRLAVGPADAPQLSPLFVTAGRAMFAGLLSAPYLLLTHAAPLPRRFWGALAISAMGTVAGFPLFLALALREVPAMHAAVVTGLLPLGTAVAAALYFRQRPSFAFWLCALVGFALVIAFAWREGGGQLSRADLWLGLAVLSTSVGYVAGARISAEVPAQHVICWVLVTSLPLTLPVAILNWPNLPVQWSSWGGFAYVSVFSMWLGFFAWYRGLAIGGTMRVSQVQLIQPFLALLMAAPVLGEPLEWSTLAFALAVLAIVLIGKRMPVA